MSQPTAPDDDLLPDDGMTEKLRHRVAEFIEVEEGSFNNFKSGVATP